MLDLAVADSPEGVLGRIVSEAKVVADAGVDWAELLPAASKAETA